MRVSWFLPVNINPLEHVHMRIASMQLLLQGVIDVSVQSQVRLADAALVDLMLTIDAQLEIVIIDQENRWTANSPPFCIHIFNTCSPQSM